MPRPRIYGDDHFRLTTTTNKDGRTYLIGYRNQWDPIKKQSRIVKRIYVGTFDPITGLVRFGKKFLNSHPEYVGKTLFYEDHELVERSELEIGEAQQRQQEEVFDDILSYGATWACWETAKQHHILEDLQATFGDKDGADLLRLAIYQYLEQDGMDAYEDWVPTVYLPGATVLSGQRISELLSKINHCNMDAYFRSRFKRNLSQRKGNDKGSCDTCVRFLAIDSTSISTQSETIEQANYGYSKDDDSLKQINFTLGVDYETGDVCYARESEGSVIDKVMYRHIVKDLVDSGFDLSQTVLVTDRGYATLANIQSLLNAQLKYVAGVPLTEKSIKDLFKKYQMSLMSMAFFNSFLKISARTVQENWLENSSCGNIALKTHLHLYQNPALALDQKIAFDQKLELVLSLLAKGAKVDSDLWKETHHYLVQNSEGQWSKNIAEIERRCLTAGCFAIRTNCIENPFTAYEIYRDRSIVELAFRQFKDYNEGTRLHATETTYRGRLLIHVLAQSLRMIHTKSIRRKDCTIKIPGNSLDRVIRILKSYRAVRPAGRIYWVGREVSKRTRDMFELLNLPTPPAKFKAI